MRNWIQARKEKREAETKANLEDWSKWLDERYPNIAALNVRWDTLDLFDELARRVIKLEADVQ